MIRNLMLLSLFSFLVTGCGGGDGGETLSYTRGEVEVRCIQNNVSLPFPEGTTCRGLDVSPSDLITPQREYWHCSDSDSESREYYFSDRTGRVEVVRGILPTIDVNTGNPINVDLAGAVFNFRWSLNTETCSLWVRFDQTFCGLSVEGQITDISANSYTAESADPENLSNITSETCQRRRSASSSSPSAAERAVRTEVSDDDDPDASGGGILSLARSVLFGSFRAE